MSRRTSMFVRIAILAMLAMAVFAFRRPIMRNVRAVRDLAIDRVVAAKHIGASAARGTQVPILVAHGGGPIEGHNLLTNSRQAIVRSLRAGFTDLEIDLNWTADGQLVCIHDWDASWKTLWGGGSIPTLKSFLERRSTDGLEPIDLDGLMQLLVEYPSAQLITDVKVRNVEALDRIATNYPKLRDRILPQIYFFSEYWPVRTLGFRSIILTLYICEYPDWAVQRFQATHPLLAITMRAERSATSSRDLIRTWQTPVLVHTVNDAAVVGELQRIGVRGFYTDRPAELDRVVRP